MDSRRREPQCPVAERRLAGLSQEVGDELGRRGRVLFHDPVTGVGHERFLHIRGGLTHDGRHHGSKRKLAADSEHWHFELAAGQKRLVIDGVLREGAKLREARAHRPRHRIERRVVLTLLLVEAFRIALELIPEAVEVDALTTLDQAFHIGAAEAKLPHARIFLDLSPGLHAR